MSCEPYAACCRAQLRASQNRALVDTAAQDAAIEAQRRAIESKQDASLSAAEVARRRLQDEVRESQRALMAQHAQQRCAVCAAGVSLWDPVAGHQAYCRCSLQAM